MLYAASPREGVTLPEPPRPQAGTSEVGLGLLLKAQYARETGDLAQALAFVEEARRLQPDDADIAYFYLSLRIENVEENAFTSQPERAEVLVVLKEMLAHFVDDYRFPLMMGSLLIDDSRWSQFAEVEDPERHLLRALELLQRDASRPQSDLSRDQSDPSQNQRDAAPDQNQESRQVRDAADLEILVEVHFNLGRYYWSRQRYADAAEAFEWVCARDPRNTWGYYYAGQSYENINHLRTALRYYKQFQKLRLDEVWPGKPPVDLNVSIIQALLEPSETALQDLAMLGSNRRMLLRVAARFLRVERFQLGIQLLDFLPASDWNTDYFNYLLYAHMQLGNYDLVFELCRDRLVQSGEPAAQDLFFNHLLEAGLLAGHYQEVVDWYERFPELARREENTLLSAALAEMLLPDREVYLVNRLREPGMRNAYLDQLVEDFDCYGRRVAGLRGLLDLSVARNDALGAIQVVAEDFDPFDFEKLPEPFKENTAFAAIQLGFADEGFALYDSLLAADPENPSLNNNYGYFLADVGVGLRKAEFLIQRALDAAPENGAYLDSLGWVLYRQGRYQQARDVLERALEIEPNDPEKLAHLGDVLAALGLYREAKACWSKAMDLKGALYFPLLDKLDP
ncbi:Tetratricopeptide repeat protein [Acanthopleuribacter pedis]